MRSIRKSWIGIVLAILFGLSLFFFRGSQRYSNLFNSDNIIASVSGTAISTTKFMRAFEMNINQFGQMLGKELTGDEIRSFQIHQLVIQNLINNAVFENEFEKLNFLIDDSIVAKKTKQRFPNLYSNNKINEENLNTFLRQQRLKIEDLVNIISYETKANIFDDLLFENKYPNFFQNKIDLSDSQSREIEMIEINLEKIELNEIDLNLINKQSSEILDFYEKNKNNYMTEETRDISYIVLKKDNYKKRFEPTDSDMQNYYNENQELFIIPEKRSFIQFNFKSKDEAELFRQKIIGYEEDDIINLANVEKIIFNEFDQLSKFQVLDELSTPIFQLNERNLSNVIETTLANHVIYLKKIYPERQQTLIEIKDKISETLTSVEVDNFFNDLKVNINQQILNGLSIQEISDNNSLTINNINKAIFSEESNDEIEKEIIKTSFSLNKDFTSDLIDYDEQNSFIIFVNNIFPSEPKKIDEVYEKLRNDWINSKRIESVKEIFESFKTNNNLKQFEKLFGVNSKNIEITFKDSKFPYDLNTNIFNTKVEDITYSIIENKAYFIKILNINFPENPETKNEINLNSEFKNAFGNEIIKTKKISLNDELLNGLLSQYK